MIDVLAVCEGQTEQSFVGDVLAPFLADRGRVLIVPRIVSTSGRGKGGALTRDRVMRYLRNTLRERPFSEMAALHAYAFDTATRSGVHAHDRASRVVRLHMDVEDLWLGRPLSLWRPG